MYQTMRNIGECLMAWLLIILARQMILVTGLMPDNAINHINRIKYKSATVWIIFHWLDEMVLYVMQWNPSNVWLTSFHRVNITMKQIAWTSISIANVLQYTSDEEMFVFHLMRTKLSAINMTSWPFSRRFSLLHRWISNFPLCFIVLIDSDTIFCANSMCGYCLEGAWLTFIRTWAPSNFYEHFNCR